MQSQKLPKRHMWWVSRRILCLMRRLLWIRSEIDGVTLCPRQSPDGLPLPGAREGPGHLLWDQSDPFWHSWLLRKLEWFKLKSFFFLELHWKEHLFTFCRQRCTTSSTRIWIKWPIQKERRNPPCTDHQETHPTINNFLASELVSLSHIKTNNNY